VTTADRAFAIQFKTAGDNNEEPDWLYFRWRTLITITNREGEIPFERKKM
jgi:hypothetical protein